MRIAALICVLALVLISGIFFAFGVQDWFARHAMTLQREAQDALAGALRALRAGQPGAVAAFLGVCFTHGFLHALGPGHGKAVIAAYGTATHVPAGRMLGLAAISSLAQAGFAVALVYGGIWILGGARDRVEGLAAVFEPLSAAAIAVLGLLLCWRGGRRLAARFGGTHHVHSEHCGCGHHHAPPVEEVMATRSWREAAALVLGVALRPCTSALFLLILTWRLQLDAIGIAGVFVMGLGTMMVTATAGLSAVLLRRGVFLSLPRGRVAAMTTPLVELVAGGAIAVVATAAALRMV